MKHLIERVRKKPQHIRDQYALYGAIAVTAVVAIIWIVSLPAGADQRDQIAGEGSDSDSKPAFSNLLDQTKQQFFTVRSMMTGTTSGQATASQAVENNDGETGSSNNPLSDLIDQSERDARAGVVASSSTKAANTPSTPRVVKIATSSASSSGVRAE